MKKLITLFLVLTATVAMTFAQEGLKVVTPLFLATDVPEEEVSVITDYFISKYAFAVKGKAEVIDRDSFDMLVEEHNFQSNDWASKEGRSQLEMLNASHLVRGKLSKFRSQLVVTIKLIDVKTGVVYATYEDRIADVEELFDKMPEICEKLAEQIGGISTEKHKFTSNQKSANIQTEQKKDTSLADPQKQEQKTDSTKKVYHIGDTGPRGGIVYEVSSGYIREFRFLGTYTYKEIKNSTPGWGTAVNMDQLQTVYKYFGERYTGIIAGCPSLWDDTISVINFNTGKESKVNKTKKVNWILFSNTRVEE
ncbi:MAG: hypothetical protein J6Y16_06410 [Treponema sp.]|nr:hypothetical protein [Treponema sp.]